jgi:hypothetical protein
MKHTANRWVGVVTARALSIFCGSVSALCLLLVLSGCSSPAPHTAAKVAEPTPPAGNYVSELFSMGLRLEAGGSYAVKSDALGRHTEERGDWTWNEQHREFLLERTSGDFQFALRRLRVDDRDPDRVQWIVPLSMDDFVGVIDYVSFKRQKEND